MDLRVHRMAYQIIPALLREWRTVLFIPWKVIPVIAVASVIEQLATTKFSDTVFLSRKKICSGIGLRDGLGAGAFSFFAILESRCCQMATEHA